MIVEMAEITGVVEFLGSNAVYVLLLVGMWLAITSIYIPGLGYPEAGALVSMGLGVVGLVVLPTNAFGLLLLIAAMGCFLALIYYRHYRGLAVAGFVLQALGSIFLFQVGARPAFWVIILINVVAVAYHQIMLMPGLRIQSKASPLDADTLIGTIVPVVATIDPIGSIRIQGELWSACADEMIETGRTVRVVGREGLYLRVVPTDPPAGV